MKNFDISDSLKNDIVVTLIEPSYKADIIQFIKLRKKFKNYGLTFETLSKFFVGVGSIMSFAAGIYKIDIMSFLAGTTSVVSLVFLQYASFSYRESKKMSIELNNILRKLNISTLNIENISITDSLENSNIEPMTPPIQVKLK